MRRFWRLLFQPGVFIKDKQVPGSLVPVAGMLKGQQHFICCCPFIIVKEYWNLVHLFGSSRWIFFILISEAIGEGHIASFGRYPHISLHFLVQCRAEIGTVDREDADAVGHPFQRGGFTGHDKQFPVVSAFYSKSVWYIPVLL